MGPERLFMTDRYWPKKVIVMTLGWVGNDIGPDFERLRYFIRRYPNKNFIAAGGIRNFEDLLKLKKLGIETGLVASALHSKSIIAEDIKRL